MTSRSCKPEPAIWSRDNGQRIPCFDRCELIITWMSNIKEVHGKARVHISVNLLFGVWPPCNVARLRRRRRRRRRRAYVPTSNTASYDNHEKINSLVFFSFLYEYGAPLGGPSGRRSSALNIWSSRGLSIKSFLIPKFVYICALLPTPNELFKQILTINYSSNSY